MTQSTDTPKTNPYAQVGRNDLCPCGSGKKFKKCHALQISVAAAANSTQAEPSPEDSVAGMPGLPPGMTPKMMWEMAKILRKVPKGQLQQLQAVMQQAMAGKDVSRQAQQLQSSLPPEVQKMLIEMSQKMTPADATNASANGESEKKTGIFSRWRNKNKNEASD